MCRMLAVLGDVVVQQKALRAFHRLGPCGWVLPGLASGHLDGWGIAAYGKQGAAYAARSAGRVDHEQAVYTEAIDRVCVWGSPLVIAHFRKASEGAVELENTHPFLDPPWIFCHNGTVLDREPLGPRPLMRGTSDTEEIFCLWRRAVQIAQPRDPMTHFLEWITTVERVCRYSSLTIFLTDGQTLLARRSVGQPQHTPYVPTDYETYYTLYHWQDARAHVICSEPLEALPGPWHPLEDKEHVLLRV